MKQRSIIRQLIYYVVAIVLIVLAVSALTSRGTTVEEGDL